MITGPPKRKSSPPIVGSAPPAQRISAPGVKIPPHLLDIAGATIETFNPPPPELLHYVLIGDVGSGKTTLGASIGKAAILDIEHKINGVPYLGSGSVVYGNGAGNDPPWGLRDYDNFIDLLISDAQKGRRYFDMVVFDTVGGLGQLVREELTVEYASRLSWLADVTRLGQEGVGYDMINRFIISWFARLRNAGYGWMALAHRILKMTTDSAGNVHWDERPDSTPGVQGALGRMAEFSGFLTMEVSSRRVSSPGSGGHTNKKTVSTPRKERTQRYILDMTTNIPPKGEQRLTRQHIPLVNSVVEIPEGNGWAAWVEEYNRSVDARRQSIRKMTHRDVSGG